MALEQPKTLFIGSTKVFAVKFTRESDGSALNLDTEVTDIEFQVKENDGDADPPFIAKSIGSGIVKRTQSGDDLGIADITIDPADTTTNPAWPATPDNIGTFRYDVVVVLTTGARHYAVVPSNLEVKPVVNPP